MDPPLTPPAPKHPLGNPNETPPETRPGHVHAGHDSGFTSSYADTHKAPSGDSPFGPRRRLMELPLPSSAQGHEKTDVVFYSSALDSESQLPTKPRGARHKNAAGAASVLPPLLPRAKKLGRRRSKPASDAASERSHRSEKSHRSELPQGGGYTLTPATGKIFRNLLILEESLRQQVVQQRTLRRKYLTFLAALCALVASVSYLLYFAAPRGPLRAFLQLILLTLVVTLLLYHLLGEYQKTIVLPRKFLSSTNKGLRQLNVRLIKTKLSLANRTADLARELGLFLCIMALKLCHSVSPSMARNPASRLEVWLVSVQLRCQPRFGLNDIKLVLVPRSFSTDIREGWELYRDEFWIKEGIRRRNYLLDFTRATAEAEKKPWRKDKKERRKRKSSVVQRASASEQNLNTLDLMSPEASPPPL